jgi:hypothetical protein
MIPGHKKKGVFSERTPFFVRLNNREDVPLMAQPCSAERVA